MDLSQLHVNFECANIFSSEKFTIHMVVLKNTVFWDVMLCSCKIHLKPHERYFISNYHFYWTDCFTGRKGRTAIAVRKGIPHNHVNLLPLVSIETTGVCIPICNSEV
jgi:hypothetical protein